jgi:mannitol-1-phosphate/altronate dehydrogenase
VGFAAQIDVELGQWIEENVTFPGTMVDRIVPAMTEAQFALLQEKTGYADPCGIVCEDFRQWVIEDNFVQGRPEWDKAGAMFVADVLPYEEMKPVCSTAAIHSSPIMAAWRVMSLSTSVWKTLNFVKLHAS